MSEKMRKEAAGGECKRAVRNSWAIITVQGILDNDFYIGTLRQGKYTRAKINGKDIKRDEIEQIVIENHHQPIIDYRTFATTKALREQRTRSNYRGTKINDNVYSGIMVCGDCGSPMFAMSRRDLKPAYTCGTYHRRGLSGCTSHHIRVDKLDELIKVYIQRVRDNSSCMIERLNEDLKHEEQDIAETEQTAANLEDILIDLQEELKATKRQRVTVERCVPDREQILEETYDEMESELMQKIEGIQSQINMATDKRNIIIQTNRMAKTAIDIFDEVLKKEHLEKKIYQLIIEKIWVYENRLEIQLKSDVDQILNCGLVGKAVNFNLGMEDITKYTIVQQNKQAYGQGFPCNVISSGDPLEIYTDRDGEVIFKKYSPMGELGSFCR